MAEGDKDGLGRSLALPLESNPCFIRGCQPIRLRNADWERRNRAIADCGRCGRLGEAAGRFGVRVGDRAVRGRVRSRNGQLDANNVRLGSRMFA